MISSNVSKDRKISRPFILALLPIPIFIVSIFILVFSNFKSVWNPVFLFSTLNIIFLSIIMFFVSILAFRSYIFEKSFMILLLGSSTLVLGFGALLAGLLILGNNVNSTVTIYNSAAFLSSILILLSVAMGVSLPSKKLKSNWSIVASYIIVLAVITIIAILVKSNYWPVYFHISKGPTTIDLVVLYTSIVLFTISGLVLLYQNLKKEFDYLGWYGIGLLLIAVGLFSVSLQSNVGDPLNWIGRIAQYLGSVYILVSLLLSFKESGVWILPLQQVLKETETRFISIIETANEGIMTSNSSGIIEFANSKMADMLGYSKEELIGKQIKSFVDSNCDQFNNSQSNFENGQYEMKFIRKDGTQLWTHASTSAIYDHKDRLDGNLGMFIDITEAKKAEEDLKESEEKYRNLFMNMTEEVHFWKLVSSDDGDIITWRLIDINPPGLKTWNKNLDEVQGKLADEIIENATEHYMPVVEKIMSEGVPYTYEDYNPDMDKYFKFTSVPFGEYFITTGSDITDVKKYQKKLEISNSDLKRTQRELEETIKKLEISNKQLEQFAYIASHDLQEPLRMVGIFTQLLERKYKDNLDEDADEYIDFIVDGAKRMKYLIDDLLTFSRLNTYEEVEFENVNMEFAFDDVLSNLKVLIDENNAEITHDHLPTVKGDPSQLMQVLQNLVSNAIKFHGEDKPEIHVSSKDAGDEWIFSVKDNGIGINQKHQDKIFEIFKRLHNKEKYEGTGMGLSICKRIIEMHNGRIWLESEEGVGSTFYFTIPK